MTKKLTLVLLLFSGYLTQANSVELWMISGKDTLTKVRSLLLNYPLEHNQSNSIGKEPQNSRLKPLKSSPEELREILKKL